MSETLHNVRFPNESIEYRSARDKLLEAEILLRRRMEEVAQERRALPLGGEIMEDYVFEEGAEDLKDTDRVRLVSLSELFAPGQDTLIVYNFMYGPAMEAACPYCTSILDSLDRAALHTQQRINLAIVAKSPIARIREFARSRGWTRLRLLSSGTNNYNIDYRGEDQEEAQQPALNVFARRDGKVYHSYNTELFFVPPEPGQDPRHVDSIWPMWSLFDFTPEGRTGFTAKLDYGGSAVSATKISG